MFFGSPAHALSGGAGAAPFEAGSPWSGVGSLSVNGQLFTATLIAPGYVITAAHVAGGAVPSTVVFQTQGEGSFASVASQIYVHPAYSGNSTNRRPGDPTRHADIAIIKLADVAPAHLPSYRIHEGSLLGQEVTLVSHSHSRTLGTTGVNRVDVVFSDLNGVAQTYMFDFDGPDISSNRIGPQIPANGTLGARSEAGLVSGDSGSAAFLQFGGQWQLAGINSFAVTFSDGPFTQGSFGTGGGGIVLATHQAWIQSVISPIPEPSSAWLMLGGLLVMGGWSGRQRFSIKLK